jgi:hypothetical protein
MSNEQVRLSPQDELLIDWLADQPDQYFQIEVKGEAGICCLHPFMYTWAILADLNNTGYEDRWCYADYEKAKAAYDAWDGNGEPGGWHRHPGSGRRRPNGDASQEFIMR